MRYTILMHYQEMSPTDLEPGAWQEGMRAMADYAAKLHAAGVLIDAEVFQPSQASTTVRLGADGPEVHDGPAADLSERLGGLIVVDVPDRDSAMEWARQNPALHWGGSIEVRPTATHVVDGVWSAGS